jgi:hypothetical protein
MGCNDFIQTAVAVKVKVICPALEVHGKKQSHQSEVMVSMQMADENVVDPVEICLKAHQLHLCTFSTIYKEVPVLNFYQLRCRIPAVRGHCSTRP